LSAMSAVVERFGSFDRGLQAKIVARAHAFSAALRFAVQSPDVSVQAAAVAVIVHSGYTPLANLLAGALKTNNERSRRLAGKGLCRLSDRILSDHTSRRCEEWFVPPLAAAEHVGEALARAVYYWEAHRQRRVLQAALLLPAWTMPAIRKELARADNRLLRPILEILAHKADVRQAEFLVRSLAVPQLHASVSELIAETRHVALVRGLLDHTWLLEDPGIARGLRRMRTLRWMEDESELLFELDDFQCRRAVRWVSGLAGSARERVERFRALARLGLAPFKEAIGWHHVADPSPEASELLCELSDRLGGAAKRMVASELRRRGLARAVDQAPTTREAHETRDVPAKALAAYCQLFDKAGTASDALRKTLLSHAAQVAPLLRQSLAYAASADRCKTMRVIRALGMTSSLAETIYRLASDAGATVRGTAVSLLVDIKSAPASRIVRRAVNDPDPRVQANALEVLDQWEDPDRLAIAIPKLDAAHNRVRAVAIRTLLPLEVERAGGDLLEMLNHTSRRHRMSALWVVERLKLRSLAPRVFLLAEEDSDSRVRRRAADLNKWLLTT